MVKEIGRRVARFLCNQRVELGQFKDLILLTVLLIVQVCPTAFGATLYVNVNNVNPVLPYTDWATAATNIQDAIEAAGVGDQVLVTNGVYRFGAKSVDGMQTNRIALTKEVVVVSVSGPSVTFIEGGMSPDGIPVIWGDRLIFFGSNSVRCAYVGSNAVLSGFTLTPRVALSGARRGA